MTIDHKNQKSTGQQHSENAGQSYKDIGQLPIKQVKRRFFLLLTLALVLIAVLVWLTLAVLEANNIEPFGELAILLTSFIVV
ncbi:MULTISPECIES: hypothetical protein [unclassified Bartonella]|uniref:hypothetical protein n=1 Tax=unclassified Bartonella TaxID=2645622 RepID=UPI0015F8611D|nr:MULTISPECIES: hypothetical protein [unclassified Bartonella]UXN06718.1 hypothetical protein N6A79_01505 [Bartonella sp. HY761]